MNKREISPRVLKSLSLIEQGDLNKSQLINMYNNCLRDGEITEEEVELLISAIEKAMRIEAPKEATKLFGPKDSEPKKLLQAIYDKLKTAYDLSDNILPREGVKTGGRIMSGDAFIDSYISYKNPDMWNVGMGYTQLSHKDEPFLVVNFYQTGTNKSDNGEKHEFTLTEQGEAERKLFELIERVAVRK